MPKNLRQNYVSLMKQNLPEKISQGTIPPDEEQRKAEPVDAVELVTDPVEPVTTTAKPVNAADLLSDTTENTAPASAPQPINKQDLENKVGCQCERCKADPDKRDKRGRHHKICECDRCKKNRGEIVPDFSDLTPEQAATDYTAMSQMLFDSTTGVLCMSIGPEWAPQSPEEREAVTMSLATYLKSKRVKDIPPGMMLTLVVIAYGARRLKQPETANKLKLGWLWLKTKFTRKPKPLISIVPKPETKAP